MDNDLIGIARLRERRLLWTNQALQRMLKRPAGELLDHSARILYPDEETYERSGELAYGALRSSGKCHAQMQLQTSDGSLLWVDVSGAGLADGRSEERRVGKECRSRWSPYHEKKKQEKCR